MIEAITHDNIGLIQNPAFRGYAQSYLDIEDDFRSQLEGCGVPVAQSAAFDVFGPVPKGLAQHGLKIANDHRSFHLNWISPSCLTCRKGIRTATFLLSVQCPRNCFFCFNPNQENYEASKSGVNDVIGELDDLAARGGRLEDCALTGGEPLLHKPEALAFFEHAAALFPNAYTRLYTSGAFLDQDFLEDLHRVGLDEIRFSIKTDDSLSEQQATLDRIRLSQNYIPQVVVEMPVMPDNLEQMKELLLALDAMGIAGINLLELCFPFHNAEEFAERGYRIKPRQYRVLHNWWYAGGLPIDGSEENCFALLEFAQMSGIRMGVHYCSLENKFSGQAYIHNHPVRERFPQCAFSDRDFFLKSAKVFGEDIAPVQAALDAEGLHGYRLDLENGFLEFPPLYLESLRQAFPTQASGVPVRGALEVGIAYYLAEQREGAPALRELRIDYTTHDSFDIQSDL
ncbi:MAG: radical SAM protein [Coriobacteriaceae bacterium]|nr:radical SAM protein [Coriobacteriaceae bacterium]